MTKDTRRAGAFLVALGSVVTVLALLAGPASAQISGGATATDGSVASGEAHATNNSTASGDAEARNNSTASGDATAINNSTASGCSTATNNSTASGDDCRVTPPTTVRPPQPPGGGGGGGGGGTGGTGGGATATPAARLALTGTWSAPMMAVAALAVAFGALLLVATSDRRRSAVRA